MKTRELTVRTGNDRGLFDLTGGGGGVARARGAGAGRAGGAGVCSRRGRGGGAPVPAAGVAAVPARTGRAVTQHEDECSTGWTGVILARSFAGPDGLMPGPHPTMP